MKEIEAVVLAGGYGRRMGELTRDTQKCLLPFQGKPLLGHVIETLVDAFGSVDLNIAVGYKAEEVKEYIDKSKPTNVRVTYVPHRAGIESWSIYNRMMDHIKGRFIGTPGDVITTTQAYQDTFALSERTQVAATLTFSPQVEVVDTHSVGKVKNERVIEYQYPPPEHLDLDHLRDMTVIAGDQSFFKLLRQYPHPKRTVLVTFSHAVRDNIEIAGNRYEGWWRHIVYPEDLIS